MSDDNLPSSASSSSAATHDRVSKREIELQDQAARLPFRKLLVIYFGIGMALIVSFMDQTAVSTAAPEIGTALNGSATIAWVGTSFLVGNCAFALTIGRLSDIIGRKNMLQIATALLAIGNLLCSFAKTPIQLYAFRAISGIGGGGVNNIAMVIVSDLVPLKERGKYQGFISAATSLGNAIGPFVGGGLASVGQWRWLFRILTILGAIVMVIAHFVLPLKPVTGDVKEKIRQVDYIGVFLSASATVFLLVPISGGGSTFAWNSAKVIVLLVVGVLCAIAFVIHELKFTRLPILPMRIFTIRTSAVVMVQSFAIGVLYYGNIFYIPIFLQYVKSYNSLVTGAFVLVYTFPQAVWGIIGGFYVSRTNHYKRLVVAGAALWTLALGLQLHWHRTTNIGEVLGILEIQAIGIGWSLQTTLVAALAATADKDRAVVTAGRNFFRTLGGAFGLAAANAIYQSGVIKQLATIKDLTPVQQYNLVHSSLGLSALSPELVIQVRDAYAHSLRLVFAFFTALSGVYFLSSFAIKEIPFRKDSDALVAEKRAIKRGAEGADEAGVDVEAGVGEVAGQVERKGAAVPSAGETEKK